MPKVKFELNREGVRELMRSPEMMNVCKSYADRAASSCGAGYSVNTHTGRNRVNAEIKADTFKARKDNLENNTILKSLGG
jgi:hypothetical protein